ALPPNAVTVFLYCSSVTIFFAIIKLVSYRLHLMFDEGEAIQRRPSGKKEKPNKHRETHSEHTPNHKTPSNNQLTSNGKKGEADRSCCTPPPALRLPGTELRLSPLLRAAGVAGTGNSGRSQRCRPGRRPACGTRVTHPTWRQNGQLPSF
ncbi:pecanex-like protein 2, partial [Myotis lucifugus]|uniref:pecanex-like protein 2 n=1 Tax=Myotis lucifugus TaxID=59463 RepID=UPI000CCC67B5